jgi:hypothetical protein
MINAVIGVVMMASSVFAQDTNSLMELFKSDVRSAKRELVSLNIVFTDSVKSTSFWAVYDEYEQATKANTDTYIGLLKKYAENYTQMNDEVASDLTKEAFGLKKAKQKILSKAYKKMAKISVVEAARFVQLENRISLLIDMQIASELPMLLPEGVSVGKAETIIEVTVEK